MLAGGDSGRRCIEVKKAASLWQQRLGSTAYWCRFQTEMSRLRASDYDCQEAGREKCKGNQSG